MGLGADPRHTNASGRDALIAASAMGYDAVARMLLSRGADATNRDKEGWNALSLAAYNGHSEVVSLLGAQADPEALDDALLIASFTGDEKAIAKLLGLGANINVRSPEGKTPLMISADAGKTGAVRLLLQNRANPYAEDNDGKTAANLAQVSGHTETHDLIIAPETWGSTPESLAVLDEMKQAKEALVSGAAVEETFGMNLAATGEGVPVPGTTPETNGGDVTMNLSVNSAPEEGPVSENSATAAAATASSAPVKETPEAQVPHSVAQASPAGKKAATRIREEAKEKPIVALNGSTLHSTKPQAAPVKTMVLAAYHEEPLPLAVEKVDGNQAEIRVLDHESVPVRVEPGSEIPGTSYEVKEVTRKFVSSKEGKGRMVDVSRVTVEDKVSGATHLLVQDVSGQSSDTYAIVTSADSRYRYAVKRGDVFRTSQPDIGVRDFQVLDIRAGAVVVKDLATGEVTTIARDGVVE